jgi:hypothetical protein
MPLILKALGGIAALILLAVALFGQLITLGGFLLVAMKAVILIVFLAVMTMIVFSIMRDRSQRRREVNDI